jgi:hypothetical protein
MGPAIGGAAPFVGGITAIRPSQPMAKAILWPQLAHYVRTSWVSNRTCMSPFRLSEATDLRGTYPKRSSNGQPQSCRISAIM